MLAACLKPRQQDVEGGIVELVGDPVNINRSHGCSLVV
jgi:hypothetical protein